MENERIGQGEILMILVHRSGLTAKEVAEKLQCNASYLSRLYRSQYLTDKMKRKAAELFGVGMDVWKEAPLDMVMEPQAAYSANFGKMTVPELVEYLAQRDQIVGMERNRLLGMLEKIEDEQRVERSRLLAVIETLTKTPIPAEAKR